MTESSKQQVTLSIDPVLVMALDNLAKEGKSSRSEAFESLLVTGVQAQQAKKEASKKTPMTVRVAPAVADQVKQVAHAEGMSANEACAYLVERGLLSLTDEGTKAAVDGLINQLRAVADEGVQRHEQQTHRLAYLLSQILLAFISKPMKRSQRRLRRLQSWLSVLLVTRSSMKATRMMCYVAPC